MPDRKGNIIYLDHGNVAVHSAERTFIDSEKDHLTQEDIRSMALGIARAVKDKIDHHKFSRESVAAVIEALTPFHYFSRSQLSTMDEQQRADIEISLHRIRTALIQEMLSNPEVQEIMEGIQFHIVNSALEGRFVSSVRSLHGGKLIKEEPAELKDLHRQALRRLHLIPHNRRSPHVNFETIAYGEDASGRTHRIQRERRLDNLIYVATGIPLRETIQYVLHAMEGERFLLEHNLVLMDVSPDNISVVHGRDIGFLHDLGGLVPKEASLPFYFSKKKNFPPERSLDRSERPVSEKELVYEFGATLDTLLYEWEFYYRDVVLAKKLLSEVIVPMMCPDPDYRPALQESMDRIKLCLGVT